MRACVLIIILQIVKMLPRVAQASNGRNGNRPKCDDDVIGGRLIVPDRDTQGPSARHDIHLQLSGMFP